MPSYCNELPDVPWWGRTEDILGYVRRVHDGDWNAYIAKWQAQLDRMEYLQINGLTAASPDKSYILTGDALKQHVENIRGRLQITDCLANGGLPNDPDSPPFERPEQVLQLTGNPVDGNVKATELGCTECHGRGPLSSHPGMPKLAGQKAIYLVAQLRLYRRAYNRETRPFPWATRHDEIMDHFAERLPDKAIYDLAAYYFTLSCLNATTRPQNLSPTSFLHRCEKCHGATPTPGNPNTPRLTGQKPTYLAKQLRRFRFYATQPDRTSHLEKRYHFTMSKAAKSLTNDMIEEASSYYASQACRPTGTGQPSPK